MAFGLLEFTNGFSSDTETDSDSEQVLNKPSKDIPERVVRRVSLSNTETTTQPFTTQPLNSSPVNSSPISSSPVKRPSLTSQPFIPSATQPLISHSHTPSTAQQLNTSTAQHLNTSTPHHLNPQPLIPEEIRSLTDLGSVAEVRRDSNRIILRL